MRVSRDRTAKFVAAALCGCALLAHAEPWKFGIMGDTQWKGDADSLNPNTVAAGIINQVNKEMVKHGVKFVVAVGDLADQSGESEDGNVSKDSGQKLAKFIDTRALYAQELYNNGIGFFPLRGNHDASNYVAQRFLRDFPQALTGVQNSLPEDSLDASAWIDSSHIHPVHRAAGAQSFTIGSSFTSPSGSLSYAFQAHNATFILLDQFYYTDSVAVPVTAQQNWIDSVLSHRPAGTHAFVFGHKGLVMGDHTDNLISDTSNGNAAGINAFIGSLQTNNARFYFSGHDHMHEYSLVKNTTGTASVHQLTAASESYKFYTPFTDTSANDSSKSASSNLSLYGIVRQIPAAQELYVVGYYVVTVDSANVAVDFYSVNAGASKAKGSITTTPALTGNWRWRTRFGNSLSGKEFVINQGDAFTAVADTFSGTSVKILGGINTAKDTNLQGRHLRKFVNTGWSSADTLKGQASRILSLWGLEATLGSDTTAPFAISLSYDSTKAVKDSLLAGKVQLLSRDTLGTWSLAAARSKTTPTFAARAWTNTDTLGAYGVDVATHTLWAVVNHGGDYAVANIASAVAPAGIASGAKVATTLPVRAIGRVLVASRATDVQVKDISGHTVFSRRMAAGETAVLSCPAGIYVLRAQGAQGTILVH